MGLQGHSKPSNKYFIFTSFRDGLSRSHNEDDYELLCIKLDNLGIKYKMLKGVYESISELSVLVDMKHFDECARFFEVEYPQRTILLLNETGAHGLREAYLHHVRMGSKTKIGWLKSVPRSRAIGSESYTYDPSTDTYFIVTPEREVFMQYNEYMSELPYYKGLLNLQYKLQLQHITNWGR